MATRTLDAVLSEVFEDDDLERVASAVRGGKAEDNLRRLGPAWEEWADTWTPPSLPVGHLCPFAFNNWKGYDDTGLVSAWMELARADPVQIDQQIVRHLLYCHSLALPDPLFRSPDGDFVYARWTTRDDLATTIDTVGRLAPLIRRNIIIVVPKQCGPVPEAAQAIGSRGGDLFPPPPEGWLVLPQQQVTALDLAQQLGSADGALDPYLASPAHAQIFRMLAESGDAEIRRVLDDAVPEPSAVMLPEVLRCPLPDPLNISLDDVVAIRRAGDFDGWRNSLAEGVERFTRYVGDNPHQWPQADVALRKEISASVQAGARQLAKELGWPKSRKVDVGVKLVLGSGTIAAAFVAPPVAAAIAATGLAPTLMGLWSRYRFRDGAYARHVAAFAPVKQ